MASAVTVAVVTAMLALTVVAAVMAATQAGGVAANGVAGGAGMLRGAVPTVMQTWSASGDLVDCRADGDCIARQPTCVGGMCTRACLHDGDCGSGRCASINGSAALYCVQCERDADCSAGSACLHSVCVPPLPQCTADADCGVLRACVPRSGKCVWVGDVDLGSDTPPYMFRLTTSVLAPSPSFLCTNEDGSQLRVGGGSKRDRPLVWTALNDPREPGLFALLGSAAAGTLSAVTRAPSVLRNIATSGMHPVLASAPRVVSLRTQAGALLHNTIDLWKAQMAGTAVTAHLYGTRSALCLDRGDGTAVTWADAPPQGPLTLRLQPVAPAMLP